MDTIAAAIRKDGNRPDLNAIGLRSRIGKGPCQGAFCSVRVLSHLYNSGEIRDAKGIDDIKCFLNRRWKGERSLLWGSAIVQSSVKEMLHCGLFGFELEKDRVISQIMDRDMNE